MNYYDIGHEPALEPATTDNIEEEEVRGHCALCGEPIYRGDTWYEIGEDMFCEDCIDSSRRYY